MWIILGVICIGVLGDSHPIAIGNTFQAELSSQVQTAQGPVVGTQSSEGYYEFHGIPYADATSGAHRFKAPRPPPVFTAPFTANRKNVRCLHPGLDKGTEDCLVVDIYTPSLDQTSNLPVMVWVKGSEFERPNENDPSFKQIIDKGVIVVSLNYRKSIFGFLCLGTETAPGNAGLKDVIAGLRWVKQNIVNFGGKPDDITLFGHGSGAAIVDLVTLSPMSKELVQKAISQSGSALAPWAVSRDNLASALTVAEALGHTEVITVEELSEILTRPTAPPLMATIESLEQTGNPLVFSPCIEREIADVEPFLLKTPYEIINQGEFLPIPFMTGFVDNEGTIRSEEINDPEWLERMENSFPDFLQPDLQFESPEERNQISSQIKTFYFENKVIPQSIQQSIDYHGDTMVLVAAIREARLRAQSASSPVYLYQFSYDGTLGQPFVGPIDVEGAAHSEELAYLFYRASSNVENNPIPVRDLAIGDILVERWTNFAKTGIPTSTTSQVTWQPFTIQNPNYLRIFDEKEVAESATSALDANLLNPHQEKMQFWNEIYAEHFLDAESNWDIIDRDDNNVDENNGEDATGAPEVQTTEAPPSEITTLPPVEGEPDAEPDSASTAVGFTFTIISAFALLQQFHSAQILS